MGIEKEGWFDAWALLMGFKHKAQSLGAHYVDGEVVRFEFEKNHNIVVQGVENYESTNKVIVKMNDNTVKRINFATCIIAAGAFSGEVAKLARIGTGPGLLGLPLPVEPRFVIKLNFIVVKKMKSLVFFCLSGNVMFTLCKHKETIAPDSIHH